MANEALLHRKIQRIHKTIETATLNEYWMAFV